MKKLFEAYVLVIAGILLSFCCVFSAGADPATQTNTEPVRLVVYSFTTELQGIIEQYYAPQHPEITFDFHIYPTDGNAYTNKLDSLFSVPDAAVSDEAPDIFTLEAAFVKKYVNSDVTGDLHDLGITDEELADAFPVVAQIGQDTSGVQKGLSWQCMPGVLMYRASLAERYLGVTTPEEMQARVSSWESFLATAEELNVNSGGVCKMVSGTNDIWQAYQYCRTQGWVADNTVSIDDTLFSFEEMVKTMEEDDLTQNAGSWSETWYEGMRGEVETLCYFLPTWGLRYTLKPNCGQGTDYGMSEEELATYNVNNGNGTYGDWRVTVGPSSYIWGGTWIGTNAAKVNAASATRKAAIRDLFRFLTLDHDFLTQYAVDTGDFVSTISATEDILDNGGTPNPFLGGQDHTAVFATAAALADGSSVTEYDDVLNDLWNCYVTTPYSLGEQDMETCLEEFKQAVAQQYPDLTISGYQWEGSITSGQCGDDVFWTLDDNGVLTISGTGAMDDYDWSSPHAPWYNNRKYITTVQIENGVTSIGDISFYDCMNVTSVSIPSSVTSIGFCAFNNCTSLTSAIIPSGVTSIGVGAFACCENLASITIPDSVTSIGDEAFGCCTSLTSVIIQNGVISIGLGAFRSCENLTSVTIPDSVTSISDEAFYGCTRLTSINVSSDNLSYSSVDGILFNKSKTTLITCPEGYSGTYTIPSSVISIGDCAFYDCVGLMSVTIPDSVTSIGNNAFCNCASLTSVTIPESVNGIGYDAFGGCSELTSINVSSENSSYSSVNGILFNKSETTLITCPGGYSGAYTVSSAVTSINDGAFSSCVNLTSVTIPDSVTYIGFYAFYNCTSLTSITILNSGCTIGDSDYDVFYACPSTLVIRGWTGSTAQTYAQAAGITFESLDSFSLTGTCGDNLTWMLDDNGVLTISGTGAMDDFDHGSSPWYNFWESITTVQIENGVTSIGDNAFNNCANLTSVTIPDSVVSIGEKAFGSCDYLWSITIPDSVTSIGCEAFWNCQSLTNITIPDSVISIGSDAFGGCPELKSINVNSGNSSYSSVDGVLFDKNKTTLITCPGRFRGAYAIPNSVTSIGYHAFYCTGLTSVTIPDSVTSIEYAAFESTSLTSVTIPDSVTSIGSAAFRDTGLKNVTIPNSVTNIGYYAFYGCTSLTSITILNPGCTIGDSDYDVFEECPSNLVIHGWTGSTAQTYAQAAGISFESLGNFSLTGTCGENLTWTLDDNGVLTISGTGAMTDFSGDNMPWVDLGSLIRSVVIEDGVTSIGDNAFIFCDEMTSVTIGGNVTRIGSQAFCYCSSLTEITIPDSVTSIGGYAIYGCSSMSHILVSSGNEYFTSVGGILYNKEKTTLITAPSGLTGEFIIPNGVTDINTSAFFLCTGLTSVTIPDTVTYLPNWVFSNCTSLMYVTIPISVTSIWDGAFEVCPSLTDVYYAGSSEQWAEISIGSDNESLTNAEIHFVEPVFTNVLTLPAALITIESEAFTGLSDVEAISIPETVNSIADNAFDEGVVIIVPAGSYAENWADSHGFTVIHP